MTHSEFKAYEGPLTNSAYLKVGLSTGRLGHLRQWTDDMVVSGVVRRGTVVVTPQDSEGGAVSSPLKILGIALDLRRLDVHGESPGMTADMGPAMAKFHRDPLLSSVMLALWHSAELHGLSSAFFDHGAALIVRHLTQARGAVSTPGSTRRLSPSRLNRIAALIDSRLDSDIGVADMAREAGQSSSIFTESFRNSTGYTPYVYLTMRRMERAKSLLLGGRSVTETALLVGYANPSKFSAAFRRVCGCLPAAWVRNFA